MTLPKDLPLSAVDPRYRELLLRGSREPFELTCETVQQATRFAQTLQTFRHRMKQQHSSQPEFWEPLYGCIIRKRGAVLRFEPRGAEFDSILSGLPLPDEPLPETVKSTLLAELKAEQEDDQ